MSINLLIKMQKMQQIPEKGLFTFYKQQQDLQVLYGISEVTEQPNLVNCSSTKKKLKKRPKNNRQSTQKSSPRKSANLEFQAIKQQPCNRQKVHKKGNKLAKKKVVRNELTNNLKSNQSKKQHFLQIINTYISTKTEGVNKGHTNSSTIILKPEEKGKISGVNQKDTSPSSKKTIISNANLPLKTFQKQKIVEDEHFMIGVNPSSDNEHNIKERFLSKVIRKGVLKEHSMSPQCQRKILFEKARCVTELSEKNNFIDKKENIVGLFQNKQITESFVQKANCSSVMNRDQNLINQQKTLANQQKKIDQYLRFQSRTEELRKNSRAELGQRRVSKVTSVQLPNSKQQNFRFEINSSSFLPAHHSSLAIQEVIRAQNSQIFQSYDVYQYYRRLKTKSKKLLRFSMIKNNPDLKSNKKIGQNNENKDVSQMAQSKLLKSTERDTIKLPLISHEGVKIEKIKTRVVSSQEKLPQTQNKQEMSKRSMKNLNENFRTYTSKNPTQIKQRLRCYTEQEQKDSNQLGMLKGKILTTIIDIQQRDHLLPKSRQSEEKSLNKKFIENSVSSKIIQNFHEKYYKRIEQERVGTKLSTLDMSENFIMNWKDSLDWESKKKLIVKKLGIKI